MNLSCRCRPSCLFLASFRRRCRVVTVTRGFINHSHYLLLPESNRSKHKCLWVRWESIILWLWKVWIYRNNSVYSDRMAPSLLPGSVFRLVSLMRTFRESNHILQRYALPFACLKILCFHRSGSTCGGVALPGITCLSETICTPSLNLEGQKQFVLLPVGACGTADVDWWNPFWLDASQWAGLRSPGGDH